MKSNKELIPTKWETSLALTRELIVQPISGNGYSEMSDDKKTLKKVIVCMCGAVACIATSVVTMVVAPTVSIIAAAAALGFAVANSAIIAAWHLAPNKQREQ